MCDGTQHFSVCSVVRNMLLEHNKYLSQVIVQISCRPRHKFYSTSATSSSSSGFSFKRILLLNRSKLKRLQQQREVRRRVQIFAKQDFLDYDLFHRAIKSCLFVSQIFGLMPLKNTLNPHPYQVRFEPTCIAMCSTVLFLLFGGLKVGIFAAKLFETGMNPKNIVGIVYYLTTFIGCIFFISLARSWPQLIRYWTRTEMIFLLPPYQNVGWSLRRKLGTLASGFAVLALVEHGMYYANSYQNYRMRIVLCQTDQSLVGFRDYMINDIFSDVFTYLPFNVFSAFGAFLLNFIFNYIWNYLDLFVMLVSISLATRFQQFLARLRTIEGLHVSDALWYDIRRHHILLCELLEYVDEHLSTIVLVAAMNNMYFICNQLLYIFTKVRWPINYIYRWFSLFFLIGRTASAFLCAASIHDASVAPLRVLYLVPAGGWTEEVQRFMFQLTSECISLTGKRFYNITRKNLFGFFATIVTYELVLLQLDRQNLRDELPNLCD